MAETIANITDLIAERLKEVPEDILAGFIEDMATAKAAKCRASLTKGWDKLYELQDGRAKINRPDSVLKDITGKELSAGYSQKRLDEIASFNKKIAKLSEALEKGFFGDVNDLNKLLSGGDKGSDHKKNEGETG
jgi:hypothetical protein